MIHESCDDKTINYRGRTKRISPFAGHCIDSTPVVRSFILQLLLRDDPDTRAEYLGRFLEGERRFMRDAKQGWMGFERTFTFYLKLSKYVQGR